MVLDQLPSDYSHMTKNNKIIINNYYPHEEVMDAAIKENDYNAQLLIRLKLMYPLEPYTNSTILERLEILITFWKFIQFKKQRLTDAYFASAVEYILKKSEDCSKTETITYKVQAIKFINDLNLDESLKTYYLNLFTF